ncbi:MAG: hypothetical protein HKO59_13030 [Phycisphaerales bacterium]|nr:hypothetical protein [Phycisphaerales bacterium]NNM26886.1 hypothetical protein [Phycisphaerales bacterium]
MSSASSAAMPVRCPRCGFDFRGEIARWSTRCPRTGTCVECGLDFAWADIFSHAAHPWLFEREWKYRPVARLVSTVLHAFAPRRFWRQIRITEPIALLPPALVAATATLSLYLTLAGWYAWGVFGAQVGGVMSLNAWLRRLEQSLFALPRAMASAMPGVLLTLVAMPLAFVVLPVTLRRARVRPGHIARIWLYSLLAPAVFAILWSLVQFTGQFIDVPWLWRPLNPWTYISMFPMPSEPTLVFLGVLLPPLIVLAVLLAWLALWWWCALRHYLRLPKPGRIVASLLIIVGLAAVIVELVLYASGARWWW